jgi:chorismate synthase
VAWVSAIGTLEARDLAGEMLTRAIVDKNMVRCPDEKVAGAMEKAIMAAKDSGDSLGGIVTCICRNVPAGLGEPVFDKLEAKLAHAMLSLPATKGFEVGSGFAGTRMRGSEHNDMFVKKGGGLGTRTNRSGGIQGGISNGEPVIFRVAFKPPATISLPQQTAAFDGSDVTLEAKGRHDPCVVHRAIPIVESMAALVLADAALIQKTRM